MIGENKKQVSHCLLCNNIFVVAAIVYLFTFVLYDVNYAYLLLLLCARCEIVNLSCVGFISVAVGWTVKWLVLYQL